MSLPERLDAPLTAEVAEAQRRWRTPGLSVGVARDGELAWSSHVGLAGSTRRHRPRRHPGDDRVHHQDLHRAAGDAAARRGPARPGGPARYLAAGVAARRADRPAAAEPHLGSAARAGRPPLGDPRRPRRRAARSRARGRGAGAPAAPGVPLLEPRLRPARPGRRAPRRPAVGGGAPRARPHAAGDDPDLPHAADDHAVGYQVDPFAGTVTREPGWRCGRRHRSAGSGRRSPTWHGTRPSSPSPTPRCCARRPWTRCAGRW